MSRMKVKSPTDMEAQAIAKLEPAPAPTGLTLDQRAIWYLFERQKIVALKKNHDYGSSVFQQPVMAPNVDGGSAILVRMSDKIKRILKLTRTGLNAVKDESLADTFCDLGTYAFLYVIWLSRHYGSRTIEQDPNASVLGGAGAREGISEPRR